MSALGRRHGDAGPRSGDALDSRSILGLQHLRPSFLDDVSAAEAGRRAGGRPRSRRSSPGARAGRRARVISHEMSRRYVLEHPVDDPDDPDDDDLDEDEDGEDDEDADEEEVETWQVSNVRPFR